MLAALGETPGRTVAKEDLLARAWPGTLVEEGNLTVQIAALRKALGTAPDGQSWIVTVPRVGYRLRAGSPADVADGRTRRRCSLFCPSGTSAATERTTSPTAWSRTS